MARATSLDDRRRELIVECGLDAFHQPPEVWMNIAIAAEARGEKRYARDCERAMDISNDRWNPASKEAPDA